MGLAGAGALFLALGLCSMYWWKCWPFFAAWAMFLGGLDKGAFLKEFEPDFYFDDQRGHIESARRHVASGHVPFGVANAGVANAGAATAGNANKVASIKTKP